MKFNKNLKIAAIAILILIIALMLVMVLVPKPKYLMHCYDGVLNSGEEDVDCGGPCETECGAHQYTFEAAPVSATDIAVTTDFILLLDEMRHRVMAFHKDSFSHIDSIGETKGADDAGNLMFNSGGLGNETFIFPCSIDTYKDQVYVVDRMNQKIKVFSKDLDLVSVKDISYLVAKIPSFIDAPGIDAGSIGFAVAGDEDFYLSDELTNKIVHIPGDEVSTVGSSGKDQLEFSKPYDLDIGPDGNVYLAEYANERIQVLSPDLKFVKFINLEGIMPKGISVGEDKILVTDGKNHQVVVLDMSGKVTSKFGSKGDSPTQFYIPTRVLLDNGMIYVVDSGNQKLAIYDNDQNLLTAIEGPKTEMMGASFAPFFIAVSSNKDIFKTMLASFWNNIQSTKGSARSRADKLDWLSRHIEYDGRGLARDLEELPLDEMIKTIVELSSYNNADCVLGTK
ncbi:MAG: 6-bladed beta-propeller, partial [Nanoarchaeota archaeon]|nr:6-bladed beta-propeller [Nanoarchaeota archaeon]